MHYRNTAVPFWTLVLGLSAVNCAVPPGNTFGVARPTLRKSSRFSNTNSIKRGDKHGLMLVETLPMLVPAVSGLVSYWALDSPLEHPAGAIRGGRRVYTCVLSSRVAGLRLGTLCGGTNLIDRHGRYEETELGSQARPPWPP